jgi:pimeloyl-ACP methyl ester carboxylesterase
MKLGLISLVMSLTLFCCGKDGSNPESGQISKINSIDGSLVTTGYITSEGLKIYYKIYGEGEPLILAHGWGSNTEINWEYTGWIKQLKPYRKIISLDIRGHGKSDKPHNNRAYSYSELSKDVIALMDHLAIEKADFMGYSMGAFMGAYLLGNHSERFHSMVLVGIGDETPESAGLSNYIASALRAGKLFGDFFKVSDPHYDLEALALSCLQMWPEGYPRKLGGPGLATAATSVLVVNGSDDKPYVHTDQDFVSLLPKGQLLTVPGTNHLTVLLDQRFITAVIDWL